METPYLTIEIKFLPTYDSHDRRKVLRKEEREERGKENEKNDVSLHYCLYFRLDVNGLMSRSPEKK